MFSRGRKTPYSYTANLPTQRVSAELPKMCICSALSISHSHWLLLTHCKCILNVIDRYSLSGHCTVPTVLCIILHYSCLFYSNLPPPQY